MFRKIRWVLQVGRMWFTFLKNKFTLTRLWGKNDGFHYKNVRMRIQNQEITFKVSSIPDIIHNLAYIYITMDQPIDRLLEIKQDIKIKIQETFHQS